MAYPFLSCGVFNRFPVLIGVAKKSIIMKAAIKILLIGAVVLFAGVEAQAQNKKKKPQDSEYVLQKERADAERVREKEERQKSDSLRRARHRDSIAESRRNDSIRYSKMGAPDTINPANKNTRDTLDKGMPPKMDGAQPKGPNSSGVRRIDFGAILNPAEESYA
jgi:hypothetical protein